MRRVAVLGTLVCAILIGIRLVTFGLPPSAIAQEATPGTEIRFEGVMRERLTFGAVPGVPPEPLTMSLIRIRFEPGGSVIAPADDPGLDLVYVESGTLTFRMMVPVAVTRAAAMAAPEEMVPEQVPADTEVTLEAGDSMVAPQFSGGEARNDGPGEAVLLIAAVEPQMTGTPTP